MCTTITAEYGVGPAVGGAGGVQRNGSLRNNVVRWPRRSSSVSGGGAMGVGRKKERERGEWEVAEGSVVGFGEVIGEEDRR